MNLQQWRQRPDVVDVTVAVVLLVGIALMAHTFTQEVLVPGWEQQGILYAAVALAAGLLGSSLYVHLSVLGVVLGLSAVWVFDTYKRYQVFAPLTLVVVVGYASGTFHGGLVDALSIGAVSFLFVATVAGAQLGGLPLFQYWFGSAERILGRPPVSLKRAPMILFAGVLGLVTVGLLDLHVHLIPTSGAPELRELGELPVNGVVGVLLVGAFYTFTQYDSDVRIVQLGPARSGKTSMLGGLAADVDRDAREGDGSGAIDDVRYSLEELNQFPELTDDVSYYEFSYMSGRPVFRKRNTISTLDYPGEKLTGGHTEPPLSQQITNQREQQEHQSLVRLSRRVRSALPLLTATDPWQEAIVELEDERTDEMTALAKLVEAADLVVFTVPLDDFLTRAVERGNTPSYLEEVRLVEEASEPGTFLVRTLDGGTDRVVREDGELTDAETGESYTKAEWESLEDLPKAVSGEHYYLGRDRSNRDRYKEEYKELIRILNEDRRKSFAWTTTMADLVNEDFERVYDRAQDLLEETGHDPGLREHVDSTKEANLFGVNATEFLKHSRQGRKVHARWIQREYVETAWPEFEGMLEDTFESFVYPVWFEIDEARSDDQLRIRIASGRTLQGSDLLLDRFEGRELVEDGMLLGRNDSLTEAGYRVLYAAAQRTDDPGDDDDVSDFRVPTRREEVARADGE